MKPHFNNPHDANACGEHKDGNQDAGNAEGVVHHPVCHIVSPASQPVGHGVGAVVDVRHIPCPGEDMRYEGDEDGKRQNGEHSTPYEAEVVLVFAALLGVNIALVAHIGTKPLQRPYPRGLLLLLAFCHSLFRLCPTMLVTLLRVHCPYTLYIYVHH